MQEHSVELVVEAEVPAVWRLLHPRRPAGTELPWRIEYPGGTIGILTDGDDAGQGLARVCTFRVPRYLLSGGVARSFALGRLGKVESVGSRVAG